ncbi:hypothetical protein EB796_011369 [Bugula neritina]|uniref:Uncharacterized protein n=1 Tax=Bugula neritina TaxID=10212 RepID=A0A7J7JV93_BUGNE|nr:hypothetical protein EB796_011369 [Bugula neritina]
MSDSEPQSVTPPPTQSVTPPPTQAVTPPPAQSVTPPPAQFVTPPPSQSVSSSSTPSSTSTVEGKQILNTDLKSISHRVYQFKYMTACNSASNSTCDSAFNLVSNCLWEKLVYHL